MVRIRSPKTMIILAILWIVLNLSTSNRKSFPERYGFLKTFLSFFALVKLLTLRESKNLSNIFTKQIVSLSSAFSSIKNAVHTELLRTYIRTMKIERWSYSVCTYYLGCKIHSHLRKRIKMNVFIFQVVHHRQVTTKTTLFIEGAHVVPQDVLTIVLFVKSYPIAKWL